MLKRHALLQRFALLSSSVHITVRNRTGLSAEPRVPQHGRLVHRAELYALLAVVLDVLDESARRALLRGEGRVPAGRVPAGTHGHATVHELVRVRR